MVTGGVEVISKASLQQMKIFDNCLCWSLLLNNFSDEGISMRKAQTCRSENKFSRFTQRLLLLIEGISRAYVKAVLLERDRDT